MQHFAYRTVGSAREFLSALFMAERTGIPGGLINHFQWDRNPPLLPMVDTRPFRRYSFKVRNIDVVMLGRKDRRHCPGSTPGGGKAAVLENPDALRV